jgi:excisionase family DNA binding protein
MTSDLFDVPEGAGFLYLKTATMREWILNGKVPYVKLGRRVFLRRQDLEKLIADNLVPAQTETR